MSSGTHRILVAPACFKGSLSALEVAEYISDFLRTHLPKHLSDRVTVDVCPIADGGDDTLSVLLASDPSFLLQQVPVMGPVPEMTVPAEYLVHAGKKLVIIEAAQAHGLKLLSPGQLEPMRATSYGVGQLIRHALQHEHLSDLIVSVGGSASTDGGLGMLQALGVQFFDAQGQLIEEPVDGKALSGIHRIEWLPEWPHAGRILIATDVVNPLLGADGAAAVFAPQKGASSQQSQQLESGLAHISQLLTQMRGLDYSGLPGAGAAGGLAYGLHHLLRAGIISGSQWIAEQLDLLNRIQQANIIITGEGRFDATSFAGKATGNVLVWAMGKPVFIVCGQVQESLDTLDQVAIYPLVQPGSSSDEAVALPKQALLQRLADLLPALTEKLGVD